VIILPTTATDPRNPRIGWHNLVTFLNLAASSSAVGFPVTNLSNGATYLTWKATGTGTQTITVDLGEPTLVDYVGIARHNFATAGIGYVLQSSNDGTTWGDLDDSQTPTDDGVILHQFEEVEARYIRLSLAAGSIPASIAVLHVGRILVCQRRIYVGHTPTPMGRESVVSTGLSESGQFLGRVRRRRLIAGKVALANLEPVWYRENFDPFAEVADVQPFFWAWRPLSYPSELAYCWAMDDVRSSNQRSNGMMQVEFSFQGIVA
jgi:hypothetical protein